MKIKQYRFGHNSENEKHEYSKLTARVIKNLYVNRNQYAKKNPSLGRARDTLKTMIFRARKSEKSKINNFHYVVCNIMTTLCVCIANSHVRRNVAL